MWSVGEGLGEVLNSAETEPESGADRTLGDLLRQGAVLRGLVGPDLVTVVNSTRLTDESFSVVYRAESGALGERIVFASDFPLAVTLRLALTHGSISRWRGVNRPQRPVGGNSRNQTQVSVRMVSTRCVRIGSRWATMATTDHGGRFNDERHRGHHG